MFRMLWLNAFLFVAYAMPAPADTVVDEVLFGNPASEQEHSLESERSQTIDSVMGTPARQLLPPETEGWLGGTLAFTLKIDPDRPNYFTAKFWGGDVTGEHSRLMLFIDGKQVGQRHLGEVDILHIISDDPRNPGRFFYKTLPLPLGATAGKTSAVFTIQLQGPIWAYGNTAEKYQKMLTKPSRGLYQANTHTDPYFDPPKHDEASTTLPTSESPAEPTAFATAPAVLEATLEQVRQRIDAQARKILSGDDNAQTHAVALLAECYKASWSMAYQKPEVLDKMVRLIDSHYHNVKAQPTDKLKLGWFGYGPDGEAVYHLLEAFSPYLDQPLGDTGLTRRAAWAELFKISRDWRAQNRRHYTNQSMIIDVNIYRSDLGVLALAPERAWRRDKALRLLYEAAGLEPWSGHWYPDGTLEWRLGRSYYQLTDQALSKELGYVGAYGEIILGLVLEIYQATVTPSTPEGDTKLREHLVKLAQARAVFRYPVLDKDGRPAMRLQTVVGWRDWYYPGKITYGQVSGREGGTPDVAAGTGDPTLIAYYHQTLAEGHFVAGLKKRLADTGGRVNQNLAGLAITLGHIRDLADRSVSPQSLPMADGQPDFVFADPEAGVVAVKNGEDIFYASLYWRARYAINNLARVHHLTPHLERDATVRIESRFDDSGYRYSVPDQTNEPFSKRHEQFYKSHDMYLAAAGTHQRIAKVPADQTDWEPGKESAFAGKSDFYLMEYGPYLVAMNCTDDQPHDFEVPAAFAQAKDLTTGETIPAGTTTITINPRQTIVLFR